MVVIMGRDVAQLTLVDRFFQVTNTSEKYERTQQGDLEEGTDRWDTPGGWETTGRGGPESSLIFPSPTILLLSSLSFSQEQFSNTKENTTKPLSFPPSLTTPLSSTLVFALADAQKNI